MDILLATRNNNKKKEIVSIVKSLDIDAKIHLMDDYPNIPDVVEDGETFQENAEKKALHIAAYSQKLCLADDSGLVVDALGGQPGVFSARFAGPEKDDELNNKKVLELLGSKEKDERAAKFVCVIAIAKPNKLIKVVKGECSGLIAMKPKGKSGFGYDPIFYYPPLNKTFAQLQPRQKNKVSHRAMAMKELRKIFKNLLM